MKRLLAVILAIASSGFGPVLADEPVQTQQYQTGQQVQASDLSGDIEAFRNLSGILVNMLLGSKSALPSSNPLTITPSSTALTISIGGGGQSVIAQDVANSNVARVIDSCPQQTITLQPNNTGAARTDLLSIQYNQALSNPHVVPFSTGTSSNVYSTLESCTYQYTIGTTTPPAGYVAFAQIVIPGGSTVATQASISYLFQSVAQLLTARLGGIVSSLNGSTGAVQLLAGPGMSISQTSAGAYTITFTGLTGGSLSVGNGAGGVSGTSFSSNGSGTIGSSLTTGTSVSAGTTVNAAAGVSAGSTIKAGTNITALGGYSVPYDSYDVNQINEHIERSNGGGENAGVGTAGSGGVYNGLFAVPFTNATSFSCQISGGSYQGSVPTSGVVFIKQYQTNGSGQITGLTMENNTNAELELSYLCIGY